MAVIEIPKTTLVFNPDKHEYRNPQTNAIIPTVTQVLHGTGIYPDFACVNQWYADRGTMVHKACALIIAGKLDRSSLDPRIRGFVRSFEIWLDESRFQAAASELIIHNEVLGVAGTADLVGLIGDVPWLPDIKCGAYERGYNIQTAGYASPFKTPNPYQFKRGSLHLDEQGGRPRMVPHKELSDLKIFDAACTLFHYQRNGGKNARSKYGG